MRSAVDELIPAVLAGQPLVAAANELAGSLLIPQAAAVERTVVPRSHLDALAAAGLLGIRGPLEAGGGDAQPAVVRECTEILAGACGPTWFVQAQHHSPLRMVLESPLDGVRERWLPTLCAGTTVAGIAFSHLRPRPRPAVTATAGRGGWRLDGEVSWATGWGINDIILIGAVGPGTEVIFTAVPATNQPGLVASAPLQLAAMQATSTVRLHLDGLFVPADDVVTRMALDTWTVADERTTYNANPAVFGRTRSILQALMQTAQAQGNPEAAECAERLAGRLVACRAEAYRLVDGCAADEEATARLAARAESIALAVTAATALVAAVGGQAMSLDHPAQRWAREAQFHAIQAQTAPVRAATLRRLGR